MNSILMMNYINIIYMMNLIEKKENKSKVRIVVYLLIISKIVSDCLLIISKIMSDKALSFCKTFNISGTRTPSCS